MPRHQAVRIAQRLARNARRPDHLLDARITARLWGLLELAPGARDAYGCPTDVTLREHAGTLDATQLEAAADRLATGMVPQAATTPPGVREGMP